MVSTQVTEFCVPQLNLLLLLLFFIVLQINYGVLHTRRDICLCSSVFVFDG